MVGSGVVAVSGSGVNIGTGLDGSSSRMMYGFMYGKLELMCDWLRVDFDYLKTMQIKLVQGHPDCEILQAIKDEKADLLVMTTHGKGHDNLDQKSSEFGSVARRVLPKKHLDALYFRAIGGYKLVEIGPGHFVARHRVAAEAHDSRWGHRVFPGDHDLPDLRYGSSAAGCGQRPAGFFQIGL